jgi:hypothetical protein
MFPASINALVDPKKTGFSLKKKMYLHFEQKHLIPFKILSIGGNTHVQSFSPLCEASLWSRKNCRNKYEGSSKSFRTSFF